MMASSLKNRNKPCPPKVALVLVFHHSKRNQSRMSGKLFTGCHFSPRPLSLVHASMMKSDFFFKFISILKSLLLLINDMNMLITNLNYFSKSAVL